MQKSKYKKKISPQVFSAVSQFGVLHRRGGTEAWHFDRMDHICKNDFLMKCCHFLVYQRKNIKFVGTTLYHDGIEYFILEYLTFINNYRIRRWRVLVFLFIIISVMYTYVIWSSWISHLSAILILRYSPSKETTSFGSYCFSKPTFTHISESTCPILMGFSAKWSLCNVLHDYVENSKLNFTDFRLILLDHITIIKLCDNYSISRFVWKLKLWYDQAESVVCRQYWF